MLLVFMTFSLLLSVLSQHEADGWLDPYDMEKYDASTKTMRNPTQPANYDNVGTKRREYTDDLEQNEMLSCNKQVVELNRQVQDQKRIISQLSQQSTCNPVFKRFLSRLLKDVERVGVPSESSDVFYDAKIKLSKQAIAEIRTFMEDETHWSTGALDHAISQILVDLKPHNYIAWKWHFEDTFGVDLDTVIKIGVCVLIIVVIMCTQMWSKVSWFVQFSRLFAVCFFISIIWNWFYLYKIAFAERQNNIVKMDGFNEKCTGVQKLDWSDSFKEWIRGTLTLQDDPCKKYYEALYVSPVLVVPPNKAISLTITTFFTEPLKHFGLAISEFLRALLKDLPIYLQIPVFLTIVFSFLLCVYISVQSAFQYGIMAPMRGPWRDRSRPEMDLRRPPPSIEDHDYFARGDVPPESGETPAPGYGAANARLHRNQAHQRRRNKEPSNVQVKTLRPSDSQLSENETDSVHCEENLEEEQDLCCALDTENHQEAPEVLEGTAVKKVAENTTQTKTKVESDSSTSKGKPVIEKETLSKDKPTADKTASTTQPSNVDVQDLRANTSSISVAPVETVGFPDQEPDLTSAE